MVPNLPHKDIQIQTKLTMNITLGHDAAALRIDDYLGAASCGKDSNKPNLWKTVMVLSIPFHFFPISQISVLDKTDFMTKIILVAHCSQF